MHITIVINIANDAWHYINFLTTLKVKGYVSN